MSKLFNGLQQTKPRTLLLFGGLICLMTLLGVLLFGQSSDPLKTQNSTTSKVPQITAIPGNVTSEKYQSLQEEDNRRRTLEAKQKGTSAIATIIGARSKETLAQSQSLGIEDQFGKCPNCACATGQSNSADDTTAAVICPPNSALALAQAKNDKALAIKLLTDCPTLAEAFSKQNPELFKQLLAENPALAKRITAFNPEFIKQIVLSDPAFAKQFAASNPEAFKNLLQNDPEFVEQLAKASPEILKNLMSQDPAFANLISNNNPALVKKLMLSDPAFTKVLATNNPEALKTLLKADPDFSNELAKQSPALVKMLLKNDPAFAAMLAKQNPSLMKKLLVDDPELARSLIQSAPNAINDLFQNDPNFKETLSEKMPNLDSLLESSLQKASSTFNLLGTTDQQRALSLEETRRKQQDAKAQNTRLMQLNEQQQKQITALGANMEAASKKVLQNLESVNNQQFVAGQANEKDSNNTDAQSSSTPTDSTNSANKNQVLIKAGTILYAALDTAVNSDEPGPVLATIIQGEFKGAKVLGTLQSAATNAGTGRPEKVVLNFNSFIPLDSPKSMSIKAVAVDPDSARTALATDVDHHYLLRYGTLLGSAFLSGYGSVIASAGTTQTNTTAGVTTTEKPPLSPKEKIYAALGQVGQQLGQATGTYFNTPNTIKVEQGTGFGLLVLNDLAAE